MGVADDGDEVIPGDVLLHQHVHAILPHLPEHLPVGGGGVASDEHDCLEDSHAAVVYFGCLPSLDA